VSPIITTAVFSVRKLNISLFYRFHQDDASFSLNTDDPTLTATKLSDEYVIVERELGIPALRLIKSVSNSKDYTKIGHEAYFPNDAAGSL